MAPLTRATTKEKVAEAPDHTRTRIQKGTSSSTDSDTTIWQSSASSTNDPRTSKKRKAESFVKDRNCKSRREPASSAKACREGVPATRANHARAPNAAVPAFRKSFGKSMQAARRWQNWCRQRDEASAEGIRATIRKDAEQLLRLPLDIRQQIYTELFRSCGDRIHFRRDSEDPNGKFVLRVPGSHYLKPEYVGEQISAETWDVLSQAAFYKTTWVNVQAEELSTFLQGHFPIFPRNDPAAFIRNVEIELTLDRGYAAEGGKHELLNMADWIDPSDDFPIGEIDFTSRYNHNDAHRIPKDTEHNVQHQWLMDRYLPRARRAGYAFLMKLPRLERVAFRVEGAVFKINSGEGRCLFRN